MKVSWDYYSQYMETWKNKKCLKPPTSFGITSQQPFPQAILKGHCSHTRDTGPDLELQLSSHHNLDRPRQ
jgi:hypothetical protein